MATATSITLIDQLQALTNGISFRAGTTFSWSPATQTIHYIEDVMTENIGLWALIHETAHAQLRHTTYGSDFGLLTMEVAAWERAQDIAEDLGITIDNDHVQNCLDTYRDWLHRRSTCPTCGTVSLQQSQNEYACHNCLARWTVSSERFCRPYRKITNT